jgi:hypothetical protein
LKLIDDGLLDRVEAWVATQDVRIRAAYADSSSFVRTDEMLVKGFEALNFTTAEINAFFLAAATL